MKSKIVTALISLLSALLVWLYVVTVVSPNSDKYFHNIEIGIQGSKALEDRELMIMSTDISAVTLHLEGNRVDLNKLSNANITVDVDVSKIYEAGTYELKYTTSFGDLPNSAITVLSKEPGSVKVVVEEKATKTIPVQIKYSGNVKENHRAEKESAELDKETITITGPKPVIDKIAIAQINVPLEGRTESLRDKYPITLCDAKENPVDAKGVVTNAAEVVLNLRIVCVKKVPLVYTVKDGGGATKDTCVIELPVSEIEISGSEAQLEKIKEVSLGVIDLGAILEDGELKRDIRLPEGVNNDSGLKQATIKVSFPELATKTITVNVKVTGVPLGYKVNLTTTTVEIEFRGPKANIDALTASDVTVTVDFSGAQPGTATQNAEITCSDPAVGQTNPDKQYEIEARIERYLPTN